MNKVVNALGNIEMLQTLWPTNLVTQLRLALSISVADQSVEMSNHKRSRLVEKYLIRVVGVKKEKIGGDVLQLILIFSLETIKYCNSAEVTQIFKLSPFVLNAFRESPRQIADYVKFKKDFIIYLRNNKITGEFIFKRGNQKIFVTGFAAFVKDQRTRCPARKVITAIKKLEKELVERRQTKLGIKDNFG